MDRAGGGVTVDSYRMKVFDWLVLCIKLISAEQVLVDGASRDTVQGSACCGRQEQAI